MVVELITVALNVLVGFANCSLSALSLPAALPAVTAANTTALIGMLVGYLLIRKKDLFLGGGRRRINVPIPPEADPAYAGGEFLKSPGLRVPDKPHLIRTYDKCTFMTLGSGTAVAMTEAQVNEAVGKARRAQESWRQTSFETRRQFLRFLQDYVTEHQDVICQVASRDTGKTMVDGAFGEVLTTCEKISWTISKGEAALKPEYRDVGMIMMHKTARVEYVPLGVLAAIIPWNYPFHNMLGQVISALFAGNALVIKVSEYSSWSAGYYASIVKAALEMVGADPDLLQIVTGYGETGAALIKSGVDKITFIGSPAVGKLVMKACSDNLTPVVLELGGKDCAIVCEDCDMSQVVNLTLRGTFQNCGQNCIGLERLIVHEKIYDEFVKRMDAKVNALVQGCPLQGDVDCGAMTMDAAAKQILALVEDAKSKGARCLAGGKLHTVDGCPGTFITPTLLVDVTPAMRIAQEEVFGPVMVIMKAKDDVHAVQLANSSQYGLGSSVFSLDYKRAEMIAKLLRTGMCNINDFGVNYLCQSLPFGGVNISGFDRFAGVEGLRGCCLLRSVTSDRFPGVRTDIPPPLQYPVKKSGFEFCKNLINLFYGDGLWTKVKAAASLAIIGMQKKQ